MTASPFQGGDLTGSKMGDTPTPKWDPIGIAPQSGLILVRGSARPSAASKDRSSPACRPTGLWSIPLAKSEAK